MLHTLKFYLANSLKKVIEGGQTQRHNLNETMLVPFTLLQIVLSNI